MKHLLCLMINLTITGLALAGYDQDYANMRQRTLRVTQGKDFRTVWARTESANKDYAYEGKNLMTYDSKADKVVQLSPGSSPSDWRNDPQLDQKFNIRPYKNGLNVRYNYISPDGDKIIFCLRGYDNDEMEAWIVDWGDWSTLRPVPIATCYVLCVGQDPVTGTNWAYYTDVYNKGRLLGRFNIDDPVDNEELLVPDDGKIINHFAGVSADLSTIVCGSSRATLQFDLTNPSGAYTDLKKVPGEPVGSCNIMLSPDDEMNALWIGQYLWDYQTSSGDGGPHSAIGVNSSLTDPSTRKDFPVPNLAPHTGWAADPYLSTNTVICSQWAFETNHARVFTYVAFYGCFAPGVNSCPDQFPRATVARFNDDLTEVLDYEQFFPGNDAARVSEARPFMWMYKDGMVSRRPHNVQQSKPFTLNTANGAIAISPAMPSNIAVRLFAPDGAIAASRSIQHGTRLTVDKSSMRPGAYMLSVTIDGARMVQKQIAVR
ncbi:MAG: hypothetical protein GF398_01515 [Chitinivibrionales bacterium]|nr:hypothetical protein [Chitinivibrionales bacterium]